MSAIEEVRAAIPELARDARLNLQAVLQSGTLSAPQRWGVAVATAVAARNRRLRDAVVADARREVEPAVIEDACAAAAIMAMNNVYYRFRHMVAKPVYSGKPARLRMNRLARPAASKLDFELFSLAVSALAGCEACIQAHEKVVIEGGLTDEHVHEAVRIAASVNAAAVALELADLPEPALAASVTAASPPASAEPVAAAAEPVPAGAEPVPAAAPAASI